MSAQVCNSKWQLQVPNDMVEWVADLVLAPSHREVLLSGEVSQILMGSLRRDQIRTLASKYTIGLKIKYINSIEVE